MKFDCLMLWVADVPATVRFYEAAFGFTPRMTTPNNEYAQLESGAVAIAFALEGAAARDGRAIRPGRAGENAPPVQIAFVVDDLDAAFERAVGAGAQVVNAPTEKPWGQSLCCVRDLNGFLIEIGTPQPDDWES